MLPHVFLKLKFKIKHCFLSYGKEKPDHQSRTLFLSYDFSIEQVELMTEFIAFYCTDFFYHLLIAALSLALMVEV